MLSKSSSWAGRFRVKGLGLSGALNFTHNPNRLADSDLILGLF